MRKPPGPIPTKLPTILDATTAIQRSLNAPRTRLLDLSVNELVETFSPGVPVWLTGSTVWLQAVYGKQPDPDGDLDLVFSDKESCERFVDWVIRGLNARLPEGTRYRVDTNKLGGSRIFHPDGKGVIDAWFLTDESIAELIASFPGGDHVKCAYRISRLPDRSSLVRLVRVPTTKLDDTILCKISKNRKVKSSYYGYDEDE